jgi:hypothetical protein
MPPTAASNVGDEVLDVARGMSDVGARCALNKTEGPLSLSQGPHYGTLVGTLTAPAVGVRPASPGGRASPRGKAQVTRRLRWQPEPATTPLRIRPHLVSQEWYHLRVAPFKRQGGAAGSVVGVTVTAPRGQVKCQKDRLATWLIMSQLKSTSSEIGSIICVLCMLVCCILRPSAVSAA